MSDPRVTRTTQGFAPAEGTFRDTDHPSENLKTLIAQLQEKPVVEAMALADRIDIHGTGDMSREDNQDIAYEALPILVDSAIDAANMVGRRDDRIAELEKDHIDARSWKDRFEQESMRIEHALFLPLCLDGDEANDVLVEFVEDWPDDEDHPLFTQAPALAALNTSDEYPDMAEVVELIERGRLDGWLVRVARPFMRYGKATEAGSVGASYSWNNYRHGWVYGTTFNEALERALEWAAKVDNIDRVNSGAPEREAEPA